MNALPVSEAGVRPIPMVAKLMGRPYRSVFRLLLSLHGRDREEGRSPDWLIVVGARRYLVNMNRLRRAHPALYDVKYTTADEFDSLEERVGELEAKQSETRIRLNAVAARVRTVASKVA